MRRNKRQGFQFSFGLKHQEESFSARSTPKFPSIEINKANFATAQKKPNHHLYETEPIEVRRSPLDLFKDMGGGIELLQKVKNSTGRINNEKIITQFTYNDAQSIDSKDNKSVKSTKSLGDRFLKRVDRSTIEKSIKITSNKKHSNSLANILELKLDSPTFKRHEDRRHLLSYKQSHYSAGKLGLETIDDGKRQAQDTLKMENSFFENSSSNIEFRETKKMLQTFQRNKIQLADRERSKIFKSFLHKARPTVRFGGLRAMNNERIESISKKFEQAN